VDTYAQNTERSPKTSSPSWVMKVPIFGILYEMRCLGCCMLNHINMAKIPDLHHDRECMSSLHNSCFIW
jgi:hypothetical protein